LHRVRITIPVQNHPFVLSLSKDRTVCIKDIEYPFMVRWFGRLTITTNGSLQYSILYNHERLADVCAKQKTRLCRTLCGKKPGDRLLSVPLRSEQKLLTAG